MNDEYAEQEEGVVAVVEVESDAIPEMIEDKLIALGRKLGALFDKQVLRRKQYIDDRMLEDYRAYQGKYTAEEESRFDREAHKGSRAFANLIRPKTNSLIAKLSDILFPVDESNFVLKRDRYSQPGEDAAIEAMQRTIVEQLVDANDASASRDVIRDGAIFGTGVYKGPILSNKVKKVWSMQGGVSQLVVTEQDVPDCQCIRPWNFFPDMNAARLDEAEFVFERQYLSRGELQDIARLPGILPTISRVLKTHPDDVNDRGVEDDMREQVSELEPKEGWFKYPLVIYHGPVKKADLACSGEYSYQELDECEDEFTGEVWFIREHVVKIIINPMTRAEFPYSVWCPEEDDRSIFGYGVPHVLNHPQKIRNSSLRMLLDNAGMSVGPQIVIDKTAIRPADGEWVMRPNKIWFKKISDVPSENAFHVYNIPNNQADLAAIYKMSRELADEETNMPLVSQSNEGGNMMASKTGVVSMVMNAQNVALRMAVKNWDDNVTIPKIRRFYDWNMEFNPDERIKCNCLISAKGSSELLLKETQARNVGDLVSIAMSPAFAGMTDFDKLYSQAIKTLQFDPDKILLSEEKKQEMAQQPKPPSKEEMEMQVKQAELQLSAQKLQLLDQQHAARMQMQDANRQLKYDLAELELQKVVGQLAVQKDISVQAAAAKLQAVQMQIEGDRQKLADETKVKVAFGPGL